MNLGCKAAIRKDDHFMRNIFKERANQRAELRRLAIRNEKKSSLLLDTTIASISAVTIATVGTLLVSSYDTSEAKEWERVVRTIRRKNCSGLCRTLKSNIGRCRKQNDKAVTTVTKVLMDSPLQLAEMD